MPSCARKPRSWANQPRRLDGVEQRRQHGRLATELAALPSGWNLGVTAAAWLGHTLAAVVLVPVSLVELKVLGRQIVVGELCLLLWRRRGLDRQSIRNSESL